MSRLIVEPVLDKQISLARASDNFRFAASVAEFGMRLRKSEFKSASSFASVLVTGGSVKGE